MKYETVDIPHKKGRDWKAIADAIRALPEGKAIEIEATASIQANIYTIMKRHGLTIHSRRANDRTYIWEKRP